MDSFHIFHTGDIHGNMDSLLRMCAHIKGLKKRGVPVIFLNAGDLFGAASASDGISRALDSAGLNALILGNHEADLPKNMLSKVLFGKNFEILGGNVSMADTISCMGRMELEPLPGVKVSITGVAAEGLSFGQASHDNWTWADGCEYLTGNPMTRKPGTLNLLVSHMGLERDLEAADKCGWFDIILGGHTHTETEIPIHRGQSRIMHCGGYGRYLYHLICTRLPESNGSHGSSAHSPEPAPSEGAAVFQTNGFRIQSELLDTYSLDYSQNDLDMLTALAFRDKENSRVLFQINEPLRGPKFKPNFFGYIASRALAWKTGCQMAFVNATAVNPSFTSKFFTVRDIASILSFDDQIMVCQATADTVNEMQRRMLLDRYYFLHYHPAQIPTDSSFGIALPKYLSRGGMINGTAYDFLGRMPFREIGASIGTAMEEYMTACPDEVQKLLNQWMEESNV